MSVGFGWVEILIPVLMGIPIPVLFTKNIYKIEHTVYQHQF
jgi:hypothetical protein